MTTPKKIALALLGLGVVAALAAGLIVWRTGGVPTTIPEPEPPVGRQTLPDLMPKPQLNVTTGKVDGRWRIYFSSIIVNVGKGDFILRATRKSGAPWNVEQDIEYSKSGAKRVPIPAAVVWGGDGHEHWHIVRVASVWLVPLGEDGEPLNDSKDRIDSKVGFCFYDHTHELDRGPDKPVYSAHSCGKEDDRVMGVGLSVGWNDTYRQSLPGQNIDVTGLPDGKYRLWTGIDEQRWFREETHANNRTWIDLDMHMTPQGLSASTIGRGPSPTAVLPTVDTTDQGS